jgi:hypothetical protein
MNGNGNPTTKDNLQPNQGATLQLVLTWDQMSGQFNVNGFLGNKVIVLGMLEMAKETVMEHFKQLEKAGGIVLAPPQLRM